MRKFETRKAYVDKLCNIPGLMWPRQNTNHFKAVTKALDHGEYHAPVSEKKRMIYLVDPNDPLGACHTEDETRVVADITRSVGADLIHARTYCHFDDRITPAFRFDPEKSIQTYSFTNWLGLAGMRRGAVLATLSKHPQPHRRTACGQRPVATGCDCRTVQQVRVVPRHSSQATSRPAPT